MENKNVRNAYFGGFVVFSTHSNVHVNKAELCISIKLIKTVQRVFNGLLLKASTAHSFAISYQFPLSVSLLQNAPQHICRTFQEPSSRQALVCQHS